MGISSSRWSLIDTFGPNIWHSRQDTVSSCPAAPKHSGEDSTMWLPTSLWYPIAEFLTARAPPEDWEVVKPTPEAVREARPYGDEHTHGPPRVSGAGCMAAPLCLAEASGHHMRPGAASAATEAGSGGAGTTGPCSEQGSGRPDLENEARDLRAALKDWGWAVNKAKVQGPGLSVKFLGVVWSGKTKVMPQAVINKIQAYLHLETVKQLQTFLCLLGYWQVFIPHLVTIMCPLYGLTKRGAVWDWTSGMEEAFMAAKWAVAQAQTLWVAEPTLPYLLTVHVQDQGFGWGLWQTHGTRKVPLGFWSQLWKRAEWRYSLIEKQPAAIYAALVACEAITGPAPVVVKSTYPVEGWLQSWLRAPRTGVAQTSTLTKWGAYLEQWAMFSSSPLSQQLHELLGPVTFWVDKEEALPEHPVEVARPYREGKPTVPGGAWYTGGSCWCQPPSWTAVGLQPESEEFWYDTGQGQSSQWAKLRAVWLVLTHEAGDVHVCTDNWAVFRGLTLWLPCWATQG
ncbi:PREDICTED: uncharacterized protein LOC109392377 [Hipposideros armiger]|uniref:Uncharacterized protein LOC109392377 n=1 Tax=Hipposideros armiger TaxID=186990 RepID=A0A8B7SU93_HIPAR|nr:PREDICTED: uncharacterized protein LOC109392377 [Hipposideros armiger]